MNKQAIVTVGPNREFTLTVIAAMAALGIPKNLSGMEDWLKKEYPKAAFLITTIDSKTGIYGRGIEADYVGTYYKSVERFDARTQFGELIEYLTTPEDVKIPLTADYTAIVDRKAQVVHVGCQDISFEVVRKLAAAL